MMRWLVYVLVASTAVAAFVFSLLNRGVVKLDLILATPELSAGVLTLSSLLLGACLGGLALYLGLVLPLRLRLRRLQREMNLVRAPRP